VTEVQEEAESEMSTARGKSLVASCPGPRDPSGDSAGGSLLAAVSTLGNLWGSSGTSCNSRGPGKRKKGSFLAFATGNHE